jgi:hypothetical protein
MPRKIMGVLSVLGVVVGGAAAYGLYMARPFNPAKEFNFSSPVLPKPNAHDAFLAATKAFSAKPIALILDFDADQEQEEDPKKYPLSGKKAWVAQQSRAFQMYDEAFKLPYLFPSKRSTVADEDLEIPYELRLLVRCADVRNQVWAQSGQRDKATQGSLKMWELGIKSAQGTPLTPAMNSGALEIYARRSLNGEIAHLNGRQAAQAARTLEALLKKRVPLDQILREERAVVLSRMQGLRDKAIYDAQQEVRTRESIERGETVVFSTAPPPRQSGLLANFLVRRMSREYARGMDDLLTNINLPWPDYQQYLIKIGATPSEAVTDKLIAVTAKSRFNMTRSEVLGHIYLTRLALHAYRKNEGRYPTALNELVPRYLGKVPPDPFSNGQPLRYRLDSKRYKLWSIGPDARDDNARPAEDPSPRRPSAKYMIKVDSSGDFVANINR